MSAEDTGEAGEAGDPGVVGAGAAADMWPHAEVDVLDLDLLVERTREGPTVLTRAGRRVAVLVDVEVFERAYEALADARDEAMRREHEDGVRAELRQRALAGDGAAGAELLAHVLAHVSAPDRDALRRLGHLGHLQRPPGTGTGTPDGLRTSRSAAVPPPGTPARRAPPAPPA
ncbi:type II toxin-antitoxin system prevent-host-death family antitoxin [Kineococcus sp. SYSU DK005]|uniref:type II toxin-antitoxin system prevent-host-death family antitoxin n=1 Tax=Kineococcus sp. SYSU DK005 TaxID=3383126 RepID=UPI003D7CB3A9